MERLISNTAFGRLCNSKILDFRTKLEYLQWYENSRKNFDDFLSQKLELWQFIPCKLVEGVWLPIEKPSCDCLTEYDMEGCPDKCWEFLNAKNRCIFEGFELDYDTIVESKDIRIWFKSDSEIFINNTKQQIFTIESLTKHNLKLTASAKKTLGI